ncbi:MAG: CPBP family intramembrane glutamic endopeptidase [Anaerolineae bacterium]
MLNTRATLPASRGLVRWQPTKDLAAVALSYVLVVATIYSATHIATAARGVAYFLLFGVLAATVFGVGLPLWWTVVVRHRPVSDLGISGRHWQWSIGLQVVLAAVQYVATLARTDLPALETLAPLLALALAIGLFEAVFWRGWVLQRLEASFGTLPAVLLGSALYAAYHVGYGMQFGEMPLLFAVGLMYAVAFLATRSILILWPLYQPMGQLVTLIKDQLVLPPIAALGFVEALAAMLILAYVASRWHRAHVAPPQSVSSASKAS